MSGVRQTGKVGSKTDKVASGGKKIAEDISEIDNLRLEFGIGIGELCAVAGVRARSYRNWRAGRNRPYRRSRMLIARALKALIVEGGGEI